MTQHTDTVAAADAAGGQFAKAFLPGLVLGLVLGLFIGAWLPPYFGEKPELIPGQPGLPQTEAERHRGEAGDQAPEPNPAPEAAPSGDEHAPASPTPTPGR